MPLSRSERKFTRIVVAVSSSRRGRSRSSTLDTSASGSTTSIWGCSKPFLLSIPPALSRRYPTAAHDGQVLRKHRMQETRANRGPGGFLFALTSWLLGLTG
jgi:hypothetical protein